MCVSKWLSAPCNVTYHGQSIYLFIVFLNPAWASLFLFLSSGQGLCVECEALWSFRLYQSVFFTLSIFIGFLTPQSNLAEGCLCSTPAH